MFLRSLWIILVVIAILLSCSKREEGERREEEEEVRKDKEDVVEEGVLSSENERMAFKNDIGIIDQFTPELFIKLTILYKRESKRWLEESTSLSPEDQKSYFEKANSTFFRTFGITESDYTSYSKSHIDELNSYMEEHPELLTELQRY